MQGSNKTGIYQKPRVVYRGAVEIGDIIYINHDYYICLYCDKSQTVLYKKSFEASIDNIVTIPSKDKYYKVGIASKEELQVFYGMLLTYRGMFRNRSIDLIEQAMKRVLSE